MRDYAKDISSFRAAAITLRENDLPKTADLFDQVANAIEEMQNHIADLTKMARRWISVEERLPAPYETVIISIATINGYGDPITFETIGGYDRRGERWEQYTSANRELGYLERVTHWMPLPMPPKEDES